MKFSVVIPTRGDVDLSPIHASYEGIADEVLVWDNSKRDDLSVYGRYAMIEEARNDLILTQDDDCVLLPESFEKLTTGMLDVNGVHPCEVGYVVCNQPAAFRHDFYEEHSLVGFGAVFHRDAPERAWEKLNARTEWPGVCPPHWSQWVLFDKYNFKRTCDIVFTGLTPRVLVDVPYENLPWADSPDRMYRQREHVAERTRMLELVRKVSVGQG